MGKGIHRIPIINPKINIKGIFTVFIKILTSEKKTIDAHSIPITTLVKIVIKVDAPNVAPPSKSITMSKPEAIKPIKTGPNFFVINEITKRNNKTISQLFLKNNDNSSKIRINNSVQAFSTIFIVKYVVLIFIS